MVAANASAFEKVREILGSPGPCITILLPPYQPGSQTASSAGLLRAYVQDAARELSARHVSESEIVNLLASLKTLSKEPEVQAGTSQGRAIFRSPDVFRQISLPMPTKAAFIIGGCFAIRPILDVLEAPRDFYLLTLSKKRVGLIRCSDFRLERMPLPKGVPETLEEALALEPPDHDLENRLSAGTARIRFGTGSGRETQHSYLTQFYGIVDRGMHEFLGRQNHELMLIGVDEDTNLYRAINTYPHLVSEGLSGSADSFLDEIDLAQRATGVVQSAWTKGKAGELKVLEERVPHERFINHLQTILPAAFEGRIHSFYFDEAATRTGTVEREGYRSYGNEDLLNVAAVQTILHGGEAAGLPANMMPQENAAIAVLRFA